MRDKISFIGRGQMKKVTLSKKEKKNLTRIAISLVAFITLLIVDKIIVLDRITDSNLGWLLPFSLYFAIYIIIGYDVLLKAARNIFHGQVFDENFLMAVATLGAFSLGIYTGVSGKAIEGFDEACAVLLFYQVGEFFQSYATGKSRKSIASLMDIRPDYALVRRDDGVIQKIDPSEARVGDIIVVNPGERVPLDGIIVKGETSLDTKALTGESLPREISEGERVISGCVNLTGRIEIEVMKEFYDSTVSKILELVENASQRKSKAENFITKFSRYYTPIVVCAALLIAIVPSIATGRWFDWIYRSLSFLVVSCPCALVISVPLSFFMGIGAASKYGILVKGSNYLEKLDRADTFVFDKTGTLTKGNFAVSKTFPESRREEILTIAAIAEKGSSHPIARSIISAYGKDVADDYTIINEAGCGIVAKKDSEEIYCGNAKLMNKYNVEFKEEEEVGSIVYVAKNKEFIGSILIEDEIKEETKSVIAELAGMGVKTVMLTGDNEATAKKVASEIGLTDYKASLLPQDKVESIENMLGEKKKGDALCFVGDGINDAPALMRSDIGIAMGGVGSDAAIEASDIALMQDDLRGLPIAKKISRKTMRIVFENIIVSIAVKVLIMILSALGFASMWIAVIGDVGVAILAILNAMRVGRKL